MKAKFVMIGYGWRADFFYRIAKYLPDTFSICAAVLRTKERAREVAKKEGVFATDHLDEALATNPDFVVLCLPRAIVKDYLHILMEKDIPVLCETPPAKDIDELNALWELKEKYKGRVQVAEQYYVQPLYAAWLKVIEDGFLGQVSNMTLSSVHAYHAVSIFRKMLGVGFENCTIRAKQYEFDVTETGSRQGVLRTGKVKKATRQIATLEFESGKVGFLDFSGEQYASLIRTRRLNIQGHRGEINDMTLRYLNEKHIGVTMELNRIDDGIYNNKDWSHQGIMLGSSFVYENPFPRARLNDDEIAIATCLMNMKTYVTTGEGGYSLQEALQDTYIGFMIEEANQGGQVIETKAQSWV